MKYFVMLLDEHHRRNFMMLLAGSSPRFPSNLGISKGNLVAMLGQVASCNMGSFMSLVKYGMFRDAKYGKLGVGPAMVCGD
jgi:hypothetical protein